MIAALLLTGLSLPSQDAAGAATRATPRGNPGYWLSDDDYPAAAMWERQSGAVKTRLDLDANGEPTGCTVTTSSGSKILDKATCELLRTRGHFFPARDAAGKPVASSYNSTFTWVMPDGEGMFGAWVYFSQINIVAGQIAGCSSSSNGVGFSRISGPCGRMGSPVPPAMAALLGKPDGSAIVTVVETHMVAGEAAPPVRQPAGKLIYERKIRFDVDANGNATNCKLVSGPATPDPIGYVVHRCHPGMRYPAQSQGKRSVEMTTRLYLAPGNAAPRERFEGPTV
jgi:TonB family protein